MRSAPTHFIAVGLLLVSCGGGRPDLSVTLSGTLVDVGSRDPVAGVELCSRSHPELGCTLSDAAGRFAFDAPRNAELVFILTAAAYTTVCYNITTGTEDFDNTWDLQLIPNLVADLLGAQIESLGVDLDPNLNILNLGVLDSDDQDTARYLAGTSASISGDATAYYISPDGSMRTGNTATSDFGQVYFANREPGRYTLTLSHPTRTCRAHGAFAGPETNTIDAVVVDGANTVVWAICD